MPPRAEESGSDIGLGATCSNSDDIAMLRATIAMTEVDANALVAEVIRAPAGSTLGGSIAQRLVSWFSQLAE